MIGALQMPPETGSPRRRRCSSSRRTRRLASRRGRHGPGSTSTSTRPAAETARSPKPKSRQSLRTRAAAAARDAHGKPDLIAGRAAIDTLQHKLEVEAELQFSNDYERWFLAANSNEIAAADLAFDVEAKTLEEALHRDVQRRFPFRW